MWALLCAGSPLSAQDIDEPEETPGPSIALGETRLYPSLRVDALQVGNVYRVAEDEISASSVLVSPSLLWVADRRLVTLRGTYDGEYSQSSESVLEHADHRLGLTLNVAPSRRLRGGADLVYARRHQTPGTDLTRRLGDTFDEPVTFDELQLSTIARYGADQARGNLSLGLDVNDRQYVNLDPVVDSRDLDFTRLEPFARFSLRISGDTRALVSLRYADVNFDEDSLDRQDLTLLGGVSFLVTGRSSGELKIGATASDFQDAEREDETTLRVDVRATYEPRDFSRFYFAVIRELDNATAVQDGNGAATVRDFAQVRWDYDWSERVLHEASLSFQSYTPDCPALARSTVEADVELVFRVRRWLDLGASAQVARGQGGDCDEVPGEAADELDYTASRAGLFVRARL